MGSVSLYCTGLGGECEGGCGTSGHEKGSVCDTSVGPSSTTMEDYLLGAIIILTGSGVTTMLIVIVSLSASRGRCHGEEEPQSGSR